MAVNPLSQLNPGSRDWTVHVYVSRLWQHRGASDDGPIKHTDIVFQDTQGNHMYGEIAQALVTQFIDRIREGRVYELKRFLVTPKKDWYRPVEGQFIIRFGRYTTVREMTDVLMDYPLCTYALTPIDDLPRPSDSPATFTDVVGIITGVSPISQYHSASRATPSTKRVVYLSNLSGHQISLVLWGERATSFNGTGVLRTGQTAPVVVLFVGTLVKPFEGTRGLSGGAPCRWYINEDLPEIKEILAQLGDRVPAVQSITIPGQSAAEISAQVDLETKTVQELITLNIWNHQKTKFYCTSVIASLSPGQRWWFSACTLCNKGTVPYGSAYKCPDKDCGGVGATPRFRICYIGSDDTGEIEFVFFDKAGKELVGKSALTLLRSKAPQGASIEQALQFGRTDQSIPREIAAIVSSQYRLVVSVTSKSFEPESNKPSYQVHRVADQYGRQPRSSATRRAPGLAIASSSTSGGGGSGLAFVSSDKPTGSGLNIIGKALAEEALLDQATSSEVASDLSATPASTDLGDSMVGSESVLPQTPSSVSKTPIPSDPKGVVQTSVQKALFQESPPLAEPEVELEKTSQVEPEELPLSVIDDANAPPASPAGTLSEKTNRRKPPSQKGLVESQSKRKKS